MLILSSAPPAVPQDVVTIQLEHAKNMCAIASVLRNPTNQSDLEANVTNYTVNVDGKSVPYIINDDIILTDGMKHSLLLYELSCGAHRVSISANNMCGESPSTYKVTLQDSKQNCMSNGGTSNNIEGKFCPCFMHYNPATQ